MLSNKKTLFVTLHTFSLTGGIEKVCRSFAKVLKDFLSEEKIGGYQVFSMYDEQADLNYVDQIAFQGFRGSKFSFAFQTLKSGLDADVIVLSHIHLLIFAWLIKKINPHKRIILFAHGIEIWTELNQWKTTFIRNQVEILAVSNFTAKKIEEVHRVSPSKIKVLNNCLDPFFKVPLTLEKQQKLMDRYQLTASHKVLFALNRLSSAEQYKGYDRVIEALAALPENVHYLLAGKADAEESQRLIDLIADKGLKERVILTGFIADEEIIDHYLLADVFVMPSKGEGFGISFIEAAACGRRSITGDKDGGTDAILNGSLGQSVNPNDKAGLITAILKEVDLIYNKKELQEKCLSTFGFKGYKQKMSDVLLDD